MLLMHWADNKCPAPGIAMNPDTVTHPIINRARRRLTSLIETNALPLRQTATWSRFLERVKTTETTCIDE